MHFKNYFIFLGGYTVDCPHDCHHQFCLWRTVLCPYNYNHSIPLKGLISHCKQEHQLVEVAFPQSIVYEEEKYCLLPFWAHNNNFFLVIHKAENSWTFYVKMVGHSSECDNFSVKISVFNFKQGLNNSCPSWQSIIKPVSIDDTDTDTNSMEIFDRRITKILEPAREGAGQMIFGVSVRVITKIGGPKVTNSIPLINIDSESDSDFESDTTDSDTDFESDSSQSDTESNKCRVGIEVADLSKFMSSITSL